jgi:hypothetical protein
LTFPAGRLQHDTSRVVEHDHLLATGEPGWVSYGPAATLAAGRYTATWYGRGVASPGRVTVSVRSNHWRDVLAKATVPAATLVDGKLVELQFSLAQASDGVDVVVESAGGAIVILDHLTIEPR